MADVIVETHDRYTYSAHHRVRVLILGAILGLSVFVLTWLLGTYVVDPLVCRSGALNSCSNSEVLAGNISAVIAAIAGTVTLISFRIRRSLWVAVASLITLWSIGLVTDSLGALEVMLWLIGLYAITYFLFSTIFRLRSIFVAVCVTILVILAFRWVTFL